jgi:two-component system, cell cycle sensor histidine kinase and response regulator CckA
MPNIRTKTILAILGVIIAVSACYFFYFVRQQHENQRLLIESRKDLVSTLVAAFTDELDRQYSARIRSFALNRSEIIGYFADRDRQGLYEATLPVYNLLRQENRHLDRITYFLPDNSVFLQVRNPIEGDGQAPPPDPAGNGFQPDTFAGNGFMYGEAGLLYTVVQPVHHKGRQVGQVLFGIRSGSLVEAVKKNFNMHTALAVRSDVVLNGEKVHLPETRSGEYFIYDFGDPFFREKVSSLVFPGAAEQLKDDQGIHLVFPSYFIRGNGGGEIGFIYQALDVTPIMSSYRHDIIRLGLITLTIMAIAVLILYVSFNRIYGHMFELYRELEKKNEESARAGRHFEQQVAERTAELAETNKRLNEEVERRKEATLSLARAVEEWQITFDAITDPVIILDKDLEVVIANKAAQEMLSRNNRELAGRTCYELFADLPERCPGCPAEYPFTKGAPRDYEVEHDYLGKTLHVSCSPICEGSEVIGFVHTAKDITQEKNLKRQLFQVQKMEAIATLAGGIAHDFNNILGAILGNADLLLFRLAAKKEEGGEPEASFRMEEIEGHVQAIKKAGNRARDLVSQILDFSRQGKTQRQNAIITPVIKEGVKLLRSSLPANIEIRADLSPRIGRVYADLSQVHQVFMNLCTNAAQAMAEKGGILSVRLGDYVARPVDQQLYPDLKPGHYVALEVKDTGHGIQREIMERIFDPFFTTRDVGEGTGMGLAVIHGIITAHEGVLDVKSEVGAGSVFTVFFPCVDDEVNGKEDLLTRGMPRGNEKILFVDDEEDIVRMISRMLEYLGYTVYSSTSAEQAMAMIRKDPDINLVISDYSMPGISGVEMAGEIGKLRPDLPVMLCSGFSESAAVDEKARSVIRKFMSKPIDMKKLAVAIREVMSVSDGKYDENPYH